MNAGELVVSLILSAGTFLAEVRKSESALDNVRDAAREAGKAVSDAAANGFGRYRRSRFLRSEHWQRHIERGGKEFRRYRSPRVIRAEHWGRTRGRGQKRRTWP